MEMKLTKMESSLPLFEFPYSDNGCCYGARSKDCLVEFKNGERFICYCEVWVNYDSCESDDNKFKAYCNWIREREMDHTCESYEVNEAVSWRYV